MTSVGQKAPMGAHFAVEKMKMVITAKYHHHAILHICFGQGRMDDSFLTVACIFENLVGLTERCKINQTTPPKLN